MKQMQRQSLRKQLGVTLLEVLLVMAIMSIFVVMGVNYMQQRALNLRLDRTALQMQQILNAGLAYYVNNGEWPAAISDLVGSNNYFPSTPVSPWAGTPYSIGNDSQNLYVWVNVSTTDTAASAYSQTIAGKLPFGYVADNADTSPPTEAACTDSSCYVVSYVTIPGQNLNNATAINFAGLYHHGGCVPVPTCPVDSSGTAMSPSVFIVPVSVSGVNDAGSGSTKVYPISSFTGYATGGDNDAPAACTGATSGHDGDAAPSCTTDENGGSPASGKYWRACLDVITERGQLAGEGTGSDSWGQYVTLMAVTRCAIDNEPSGSEFTVYSN